MLYVVNDLSFSSREEAAAAVRLCRKNNTLQTAGILTVSVRFPAGRAYTYFADRKYEAGEQAIVPTPDGLKAATVLSCQVQTKQELELMAKARRFAYSDYKETWGPVKPQKPALTAEQQESADALYHALLGWAKGSVPDVKYLTTYMAKYPDTPVCVLEDAAERAAKFSKYTKEQYVKLLRWYTPTAA